MYRYPQYNIDEFSQSLSETITKIIKINCVYYVLGDINCSASARIRGFSQKKTAVFGCLTNALAPPPIALESCSMAQMYRPV